MAKANEGVPGPQGETGPQGPNGDQGDPGIDAIASYSGGGRINNGATNYFSPVGISDAGLTSVSRASILTPGREISITNLKVEVLGDGLLNGFGTANVKFYVDEAATGAQCNIGATGSGCEFAGPLLLNPHSALAIVNGSTAVEDFAWSMDVNPT